MRAATHVWVYRASFLEQKGDSDGGVSVKAQSTARFIKPSIYVGNVGLKGKTE